MEKMATPNYQYEKRQKALAKKKKQDEKRQRRQKSFLFRSKKIARFLLNGSGDWRKSS